MAGPVIVLTAAEAGLFDFLRDVVAHNRLDTVLRVAGGWVRDKLLGKQSPDIDIAVDNMTGVALAELVNARLAELGKETHSLGVIMANPEQSKHLETVAVRVFGFDLDLVNLRSETYADGSRIPTVEFGSPHSDAVRRDLTINALFYNLDTRAVEDLCGRGLTDLEEGICRTPLEPLRTFLDDPLRVLRAVRFSTRLGFELAPDLVAAARTADVQQALRHKVSRERVLIELDKTLAATAPISAFRRLRSMGLLAAVFALPDGCARARPIAEAGEGAGGQGGQADAVVEWGPVDAAADAAARAVFEDAQTSALEAVHSVVHGSLAGVSDGRPMVEVDPAADVRRLVWLAAALLPAREQVLPFGKRDKPTPFAEVVMRSALPGLSTSDIAAVLRLHASVPEVAGWCARPVRPAELSRLELGLRVREAGPLWRAAFALGVAAAAPHFDARGALPSGEDIEPERLYAARAQWSESARPHARAVALLCRRVDELGLADAHALRPLLSGAELMREAALPKGPAVGRAARALLEFQLARRDATRDEAVSFLKHCAWGPAGPSRRELLAVAGSHVTAGLAAFALARETAGAAPPISVIEEQLGYLPVIDGRGKTVYTPSRVFDSSTPQALELAKHLKREGATFYGAFWCPHCRNQRRYFGKEALGFVNYVECDARGIGSKANVCARAAVDGYPTWMIGKKRISGERSLADLAQFSNFPGVFDPSIEPGAGAMQTGAPCPQPGR
ncbi:hypothetical protein T492DRAFT_841987 [Pavlovales sp. CCMP2436]|nr:hypothetical protein T492DRAFT_841987 [Pavlovales sp. CCMP2436]